MTQLAQRRVLLLYKELNPSTRLCGHCQLEALAARNEIAYRHCPAAHVRKQDIDWAEIVLLCRLDNDFEHGLTRLLKKAGKYLTYVIDDDLLNVPAHFSSGAYYALPQTQANIRGMIGMSDAIVSPSPVLLGKYAAGERKGILLEEPAIYPLPYSPHDSGKPVRIGFAGSIDRAEDIESILRSVLVQIKQEYAERVEFVFFGAKPSFALELDAQCVPYCNSYEAYRETLNGLHMDIGLAPMPETPFHACKHYNKFIEYAAAGIVGIFSAVKPYDRLADQFGWELICPNITDAWYDQIKQLLDNPQQLDEWKLKAARLAKETFGIQTIAQAFKQELLCLPVKLRQDKVSAAAFYGLKLGSVALRLMRGLKRHGMKAPLLVFQKIIRRLKK